MMKTPQLLRLQLLENYNGKPIVEEGHVTISWNRLIFPGDLQDIGSNISGNRKAPCFSRQMDKGVEAAEIQLIITFH